MRHELGNGAVATRLPAQDLERARRFYAQKLGLEPSEERPGGLLYRCRSGEFALFQSPGGPSGDHTQMAWEVEDIEATVRELRDRGVHFDEYDVPGLRTVDGIAEVEGNYPSKGGKGSGQPGFATAKATSSASASGSGDRGGGVAPAWSGSSHGPPRNGPARRLVPRGVGRVLTSNQQ